MNSPKISIAIKLLQGYHLLRPWSLASGSFCNSQIMTGSKHDRRTEIACSSEQPKILPVRHYSTACLTGCFLTGEVSTVRLSEPSQFNLPVKKYTQSILEQTSSQREEWSEEYSSTQKSGNKVMNSLADRGYVWFISCDKDTVVKKNLGAFQNSWQSCRHYSTGRETVEKKLLHLMDLWEMEKAVALLQESVEEGVLPHPNVVLNLQQQLANLGEVECLLNLHDFLREHNLITDDKFFHCLKEAYYNSGRISEGVAVLRLLYHRTRKFVDVEIYFTLLTVMVLRHFPHHMELILSFVTDLKDAEEPVLEPEASLWKCYMMMEKWSDADNLLLDNEELRPLLPKQVTRVCQDVDKADFDKVAVLSQMLDLPFIRQKLRVLVAETLIAELCSQKQWPRLLKSLKRIKSLGLPLHVDKLSPVLDDLKRSMTAQYDGQIQELMQWRDSLQEGGKQ